MKKEYFCEWHQEAWVELWEGQWLCESCYQEEHIERVHILEEESEQENG